MKKNWIIPLLTICIIIFVIFININENTKTVISIEESIHPAKIVDITHFGKSPGTAVKYTVSKNIGISNNPQLLTAADFNNQYFITTEYETQLKTIGKQTSGERKTNYFNLYIYDISSEKENLIKKVNVYDEMIMRDSKEEMLITYRGSPMYGKYLYASFRVTFSDPKIPDYTILYNLENNEWVLEDELLENKKQWGSLPEEASIISKTNFSDQWIQGGKIFVYGRNILLSSTS